MKTYNPFITAISRIKCSSPLEYLLTSGRLDNVNTVLDFGAGKLKDFFFLISSGYKVEAYDKFHPSEEIRNTQKLNQKYDVVICNYVFNVIKTKQEFFETLKIFKKLNAKEKYIAIRNDVKSIKPNWKYIVNEDVYATGRSYQRFISESKLTEYFGKNKLIYKTDTYLLLKLECL